MSFRSVFSAGFGYAPLGLLPGGGVSRFSVFSFPDLGSEPRIHVFAPDGIDIGYLPLDIQDSQVSKFRFRYGVTGSLDFSIELNAEPEFPQVRFAEMLFYIGNRKAYRGYISKYPGPEKKISDPWRIAGLSMSARFDKKKIALKSGVNLYQIDSISVSGSYVTITLDQDLGTDEVLNCVALVQDATDSDNNGRYQITAFGVNQITFFNPAGHNQALPVGVVRILPLAWSSPITLVSDLIKQVIENYTDDIPIITDTSLIEDSTGIVTGDTVDLDGMKMTDFFAHMRTLAQDYRLYIDEDKRVVFQKKSTSLVAIIIIGYEINETQEVLDDSEVINRWYVNQKKDRTVTAPQGFKAGAVSSDATSIANYGLLESEQDVPVYYGTGLCQAMADALVQSTKDPKNTITAKNVPFDYYELGLYKIITHPRMRDTVLHECETLTGWTYNAERMKASIITDNVIYGNAAIKIAYDWYAEGEVFYLSPNLPIMKPERLRFWYRGNRIGQKITFMYGENSYTENEVSFSCYTTRWRPFDVDLTAFTGSKLGQFGFRLDDSGEVLRQATFGSGLMGTAFAWGNRYSEVRNFFIDEITLYSLSSEHKTIELTEVEVVAEDTQVCNLTFGPRLEGMPEYLAKQFRNLETARIALRS